MEVRPKHIDEILIAPNKQKDAWEAMKAEALQRMLKAETELSPDLPRAQAELNTIWSIRELELNPSTEDHNGEVSISGIYKGHLIDTTVSPKTTNGDTQLTSEIIELLPILRQKYTLAQEINATRIPKKSKLKPVGV